MSMAGMLALAKLKRRLKRFKQKEIIGGKKARPGSPKARPGAPKARPGSPKESFGG